MANTITIECNRLTFTSPATLSDSRVVIIIILNITG